MPAPQALSDIVLTTIKQMQSKFKSLDHKLEISPTDILFLSLPAPKFNDQKEAIQSLKLYVKNFFKILSTTLQDVTPDIPPRRSLSGLLLKIELLGSQKVFKNFTDDFSRVILALSFSITRNTQQLDITVWSNIAVARLYNHIKIGADIEEATKLYCDEVIIACNAICKAIRLLEIKNG